jgi:SAM-dependent methyltransferase
MSSSGNAELQVWKNGHFSAFRKSLVDQVHLKALFGKMAGQRLANQGVVVDDQDISHKITLKSFGFRVKNSGGTVPGSCFPHFRQNIDPGSFSSIQFGQTILDIGTGLGSLAREFAKRLPACRIYGIDISVEMLTEAHRINMSEGISNLTLMLSDINHMAFEDNVFDVIVSFGALHHLSTITKAFSEIRRVLKERGEAFLYDVRKNPPQEVVTEIADGMSSFHKRAFLESVKEGIDISYIETILQGLGVTRYSLSYPTYSRATVV